MNEIVGWLGFMILMLAIELFTMRLWTSWIALGALAASISAAVGLPSWAQYLIFLAVTLLLIWFVRPTVLIYFKKEKKRSRMESMVGRRDAVVISKVNNLEQTGTIRINGNEYLARSVDRRREIQPGSLVEIVSADGSKLYVKPREN